jgi:hypothetical protein
MRKQSAPLQSSRERQIREQVHADMKHHEQPAVVLTQHIAVLHCAHGAATRASWRPLRPLSNSRRYGMENREGLCGFCTPSLFHRTCTSCTDKVGSSAIQLSDCGKSSDQTCHCGCSVAMRNGMQDAYGLAFAMCRLMTCMLCSDVLHERPAICLHVDVSCRNCSI